MTLSYGYNNRIRGSFSRIVYNKLLEDQEDLYCKHDHWYSVKLEKISYKYSSKFVQSFEDADTKHFLNMSQEKSNWMLREFFHIIIKFILSWFITNTSINGLLNRGSMFVLSSSQFQTLLDINDQKIYQRMLDLGAGDGAITNILGRNFDMVDVTELSSTMRWRLEQKQFNIVDVDTWSQVTPGYYQLISCFNLLDRCSYPIDILKNIHSILIPGEGKLLIALVLPFKPFVEMNSTSHKANQRLNIRGHSLESDFNDLMENVLEPIGFELIKFTRVPYLCEGDLHHSYYVLHDVVLLLTPRSHVIINEPKSFH